MVEKQGFLAKLRGSLPSLKSAEKRVGEFILGNPDRISVLTITEVAGSSKVAEATVVRFCRTFGFKGYQDMKISLVRELVSPVITIDETLNEKDEPQDIFKKVFRSHIQALEDTLSILDERQIQKAVETIRRAERIFWIGVGTSGPNVIDAFNKFSRLGINCLYHTDSHLQIMTASLLTRKDVVIAISHSGSTKDPIETLEAAKRAGAATICITNNALSPITKVSDIKLFTASRETKFRNEALTSRTAQTAIVNSLYMSLAFNNVKKTLSNMKKIEKAIVIKQY
ncbi:MAG: hypothetical protein A2161_03165 [Candidatus Schekmanbacteria bacterium RBG_13_48_7]|uniref:RpiR family transcriptional regulator n=1 Tax=Candidatus Schekmanbacteria bacterium RBG_13_48_7 TaxID=1817878 RepID=A0A1F7RSZ5_9BACT|nr:MAG: hypothetical protein A2161_03165 [Candidatus Schekmanbacteria bacterium RBG_13_48_7]